MVSIVNPQLFVEGIDDAPLLRTLRVVFDLVIEREDLRVGSEVTERVTVRERDLHDATFGPDSLSVTSTERYEIARPGTTHRAVAAIVERGKLDVQEDWWRSDHSGGMEPIAEFQDHLQAEIAISIGDQLVAEATTPIATGSWGVLGRD